MMAMGLSIFFCEDGQVWLNGHAVLYLLVKNGAMEKIRL